jgi:hypothetical protein
MRERCWSEIWTDHEGALLLVGALDDELESLVEFRLCSRASTLEEISLESKKKRASIIFLYFKPWSGSAAKRALCSSVSAARAESDS